MAKDEDKPDWVGKWSRVIPELAGGNFLPLGVTLIIGGQMIAYAAWVLAAISWGSIALLGSVFPALLGLDGLPQRLGVAGLIAFGVAVVFMGLMPARDAGKQGIWPFIDPRIDADIESTRAQKEKQRREWDEQRRKWAQEEAGADHSRRDQQAEEAAARRADEARRRAEEAEAEARRKREASPSGGPMTRQLALEILELKEGATKEEINKAFKRLMGAVHPDKGGSKYFATQLNAARELLLG